MQEEIARNIAFAGHAGEHDSAGRPLLEHLARVAAAVPPDARAVAWLHHLAHDGPPPAEELRARGLAASELEAIELLTRGAGESYELYVLRIAYAWGEAGALARTVKLADLDDRLAGDAERTSTPPYGCARRRISVAHGARPAVAGGGLAATG